MMTSKERVLTVLSSRYKLTAGEKNLINEALDLFVKKNAAWPSANREDKDDDDDDIDDELEEPNLGGFLRLG